MKAKTAVYLFLILISVFAANAQAEVVRLATGEWAPYTSEALPEYGFFSEIVSEVLATMQLEAEYVFYPWRRCYDSVIKGTIWAAFPYSHTEERAAEVLFSDIIAFSTSKFFYYERPGTSADYHYEVLEDLAAHKMGGVIGYFYEETFEKAGLNVDYVAKELQALEKLVRGRIDLLPLNELVGWQLIAQNFPDQIDRFGALAKPFSESELRLIVSKSYPGARELLQRFNSALAEVKAREPYRDILRKYHLID